MDKVWERRTVCRIKSRLAEFLTQLFPQRCVLCQHTVETPLALCPACHDRLPHNIPACHRCALPLAEGHHDGSLCGRCVRKQPFYDYAASLFRYEDDVIAMVHQMKFSKNITLSRSFGELLSMLYEQQVYPRYGNPDCLLPVPLHPFRLRQRGYNQSIEISRVLATVKQLPLELKAVVRARRTVSQTGLNAGERQKNMRSAFRLKYNIPCRHVLIVDDVVTTGATVNELARLLKRNGVQQVGVLSIARAPVKN